MRNKHSFFSLHNTLVEEASFWHWPLQWLYFSFWGKIVRRIVRLRVVSRLYGWYHDGSWTTSSIQHFIAQYSIDTTEFAKPVEQFSSFNDFFIRKLKVGARSVDPNQRTVVSPGDGKLLVIPDLAATASFMIKGTSFTLTRFLDDATPAQQFDGGTLCILRLAPYDYHRYHFPVDGIPGSSTHIRGKLESVNPMVYRSGVQPLIENERHIIPIATKLYGDVAMVVVGALFVGRIHHTYALGRRCKRGDEAGYFACGGSTVVLVFKKGTIVVDPEIVERSAQGIESAIKAGSRLAEVSAPRPS